MSSHPTSQGSPSAGEEPVQTAGQKSVATVLRHKAERRAERLEQIRDQTADGSLVIRQMTDVEHVAATKSARATNERNQARGRRH